MAQPANDPAGTTSRGSSAPQGTPQPGKHEQTTPTDLTTSDDPLMALSLQQADGILAEREQLAQRRLEITKERERTDLASHLFQQSLAQRRSMLDSEDKKLNDEISAHNKRHNIVVPKQIEPPKAGTTPAKTDSAQPEQSQQHTLGDDEYETRKSLSARLDNYAGKPDSERPDVAYLCEEAGLKFTNLNELREELWMKENDPLTHQTVRQAVNAQLRSRYSSEPLSEEETDETAKTSKSTLPGGIMQFFKEQRDKNSGDRKHI